MTTAFHAVAELAKHEEALHARRRLRDRRSTASPSACQAAGLGLDSRRDRRAPGLTGGTGGGGGRPLAFVSRFADSAAPAADATSPQHQCLHAIPTTARST
ncbi:MAG: hypothetical protein MZV64_67990 [Ignavibacteriales bacterium]|nr:hypothetical protein [Ignavibacteriales bacterium]